VYYDTRPSMNESTASRTNARSSDMLWGFWYPALRSEQLRRHKLLRAMLLDVPLVLGRDAAGKPFALRDVCPHRAFPLSFGLFDGKTVECAYHGWQFDAHTGQCQNIPSLTEDSKLKCERIYAGSFPCDERDGYVWAYMSNPEGRAVSDRPPAPPPPELPTFSPSYKIAHLYADLPCGVDQAIIGLMDPAHGPFVHQAWWWRSRASIHEKTKHFEPIPEGFRMSSHAPSANSAPYKLLGVYGEAITTTIDFVLPNRRYETIRAGKKWFASLTTVTPVTPSTCRIDVLACWNVFYRVPFVTPIATFFGARFVRQDQQTMVEQAEGLRYNPGLMLIDDADKPAKWYFALKQARLKGTGEHPLSGPVTLHWRS
jgi:phenylpropionate dioxygenase-like ring-hydroxylating dioxygenase large terminal subunit